MTNRRQQRPLLEKDLVLHTYDAFLVAQTRLFTLATSTVIPEDDEVARRQELLLLDDLTVFAISIRRLIELTRLKSFANRNVVPFAYLDQREEPYVVAKSDSGIGFLTLVNKLVHAARIEYINTKEKLVPIFVHMDTDFKMQLLLRRTAKTHRKEQVIEPLLLLAADDDDPILFSMGDMIAKSVDVSEKILEVCSSQKLFLELHLRGAD